METLSFEQAKLDNLNEILNITKRAVDFMQNVINIDQWDENYPNQKTFEDDIFNKELYVLKNKNNTILGYVCINKQIYEEYNQVIWNEDTNFKTLHRICIDPTVHGNGYGQKIFELAESVLKDMSIPYVRIDTFSLNTPMNNLILKSGYSFKGQMNYKENKPKWNCYEKKL